MNEIRFLFSFQPKKNKLFSLGVAFAFFVVSSDLLLLSFHSITSLLLCSLHILELYLLFSPTKCIFIFKLHTFTSRRQQTSELSTGKVTTDGRRELAAGRRERSEESVRESEQGLPGSALGGVPSAHAPSLEGISNPLAFALSRTPPRNLPDFDYRNF